MPMTLRCRQPDYPAIAELLRRKRIAARLKRGREEKKRLLKTIGKRPVKELRQIVAGTAEALLREIAEREERALRDLAGVDIPDQTYAEINRVRAFLGMELLRPQ